MIPETGNRFSDKIMHKQLGRVFLGSLDETQVGDDRARVVAREAETRHVGMGALQALPKPVREIVKVNTRVERTKCWGGDTGTRACSADRMTSAAHVRD